MNELIVQGEIRSHIFTLCGKQVMVDRNLVTLYKVKIKVLNQAVKRNVKRFLSDFMFPLLEKEKNKLIINCDRFEKLKQSTVNPKMTGFLK